MDDVGALISDKQITVMWVMIVLDLMAKQGNRWQVFSLAALNWMVAKAGVRVLSVPVSGTRAAQRASFSSFEQCGELGKGQSRLEHEAGNASPLQGLCCGGRDASCGEVSLPSNSLVLWYSLIRSPLEVTSIFFSSRVQYSVWHYDKMFLMWFSGSEIHISRGMFFLKGRNLH